MSHHALLRLRSSLLMSSCGGTVATYARHLYACAPRRIFRRARAPRLPYDVLLKGRSAMELQRALFLFIHPACSHSAEPFMSIHLPHIPHPPFDPRMRTYGITSLGDGFGAVVLLVCFGEPRRRGTCTPNHAPFSFTLPFGEAQGSCSG
ncbi:hypothetical protein B0J12DRAFT_648873 [Macrophomina phaseolina]|uniref:Uncharacterized protein n=1 Tax=Macrophomina phaseolina TaxID=35725 RepID=A0ABQ8GLD2_9PEZI|nr:hypothetical protein B0J12DRAFT_648873 [Macrophomina phaseolina]